MSMSSTIDKRGPPAATVRAVAAGVGWAGSAAGPSGGFRRVVSRDDRRWVGKPRTLCRLAGPGGRGDGQRHAPTLSTLRARVHARPRSLARRSGRANLPERAKALLSAPAVGAVGPGRNEQRDVVMRLWIRHAEAERH